MTTHADLSAMTNKELVAIYNGLAEQCGANDLKNWKGKKELLVDRILEMREQVAKRHPEPMWDDEPAGEGVETIAEASHEELDRTLDGLGAEADDQSQEAAEETEDQHVEPETAPEQPASERTIKAASIELLCLVDHYEDRDAKPNTTDVPADHPKARSVGIAYDEIIRRIQDEFPGCQTSVACLRWYAVKIRVGEKGYEDLRLPQSRPRAKPKTSS